jgi:hypothetical protein
MAMCLPGYARALAKSGKVGEAKKKVRPPVPDFPFPRLLRANLDYQKNGQEWRDWGGKMALTTIPNRRCLDDTVGVQKMR